jgi:hypothetical protein
MKYVRLATVLTLGVLNLQGQTPSPTPRPAPAQSAAPAQPPTPVAGPTMEQTLAFINRAYAEQGPFEFTWYATQTYVDGDRESRRRSGDSHGHMEALSATASVFPCVLHISGGSLKPTEIRLSTIDPRSVGLTTWAASADERAPQYAPHETVPEVFIVRARQPVSAADEKTLERVPWLGIFLDKSLAERVAKAYIHAIVLCGGGSDSAF